MSNIEQHVTSRELSERLAKLGVKHTGLLGWFSNGNRYFVYWSDAGEYKIDSPPFTQVCGAFLSSELGEILKESKIQYAVDGDQWCCLKGENLQNGKGTFGDTEVEACGLMLEYLIKNKFITLI